MATDSSDHVRQVVSTLEPACISSKAECIFEQVSGCVGGTLARAFGRKKDGVGQAAGVGSAERAWVDLEVDQVTGCVNGCSDAFVVGRSRELGFGERGPGLGEDL